MTAYHPRVFASLAIVFDGKDVDDTKPLIIDVIPSAATVELNGFKEADTWDLEFDARVLPIDPDLIRSAAVEIYMWAAEGLDPQGDRFQVIASRRMLVGLADEVSLSFSDNGRTVRMDGRDYTALLIDPEWDPRKKIPSGLPLDKVVQQIINDAVPVPLKSFTLTTDREIAQLRSARTLKVTWESDRTKPIVGSKHRGKRRGGHVKPGKNVWDTIYDLCLAHGFLVYVEGTKVVITDLKKQTAKSLKEAPRFIYGKNLSSLEIERKLGKERVPQVIITAYDSRTRRRIHAIYPSKHKSPHTGLGTARDERIRIVARNGVKDRETLLATAKEYWESIARGEIAYRLGTPHMADTKGRDLLQIKAGTAVGVQFDAFRKDTMRELSISERIEYLRGLGFHEEVSKVIAVRFESLGKLMQAYHVSSATHSISAEGGYTLGLAAKGFVYTNREEAEARGENRMRAER